MPNGCRRDRGSARRSDDMAHMRELADRAFGPLHGRSVGPGFNGPPAPVRSEFEHLEPRVGGQDTRAGRPARAGDERPRHLTGGPGDRWPRGRRRRARRAGSPRPARARSGAPGVSTPITSRASLSRRCASRPVRSSSPGSSSRSAGSKRPLTAPSATACSVVTSVRRRCVSRSSRSAASGASSRAAACRRERGLALDRPLEPRARRLGVGGSRVREQPAGRVAAARLDHPRRRRRDRLDVSRAPPGRPRRAPRPVRRGRIAVRSRTLRAPPSADDLARDRPIRRYSPTACPPTSPPPACCWPTTTSWCGGCCGARSARTRASRSSARRPTAPRRVVLARQLAPDVVVLDLSMPHLDGFEVAGRAAPGPAGLRDPRVLRPRGRARGARAAGADRYLEKGAGFEAAAQAAAELAVSRR